MTPRDRFMLALTGSGIPDRVPYFEYGIDSEVVRAAFGDCPSDPLELNRLVGKVDLEFWRKPPTFSRTETSAEGRGFHRGLINDREDYREFFQLPPAIDQQRLEGARQFVENKGEFAAGLVVSLTADSVLLSMGFESFALAVHLDPGLIAEMMDRYVDWTLEVLEAFQALDFDFVLTGDDIAHKTAPFMSPEFFGDVMYPRMRRVADAIKRPWIAHCDGNLMPIIEEWLSLGMSGIHPIEPGAMDIFELKQRFGRRVTLLGNIDINILSLGTPSEVRREVQTKMERLAPGGRYVAASSTSIPNYVKPENFRALVEAIEEFGRY